ncbi:MULTISPECIES: DUF6542 domain-containing protein [Streptomyces]|uniref:DUF6542 domain-containing protein n=1 Tax=Streptomyces TaxID=1883 RepID=UPI001EFC2995|nr:DUF6542 domain-containing protein [Streptomyces sp. CL12-4]MCG8971899.1 hypothetical protein [Streptomyces sp. CL12-4]
MEQHGTRPAQYGPRRGRTPLPPQGRGAGGEAARPPVRPVLPGAGGGPRRPAAGSRPGAGASAPLVLRVLRRVRATPNPRLTGLGSGLFCAAVMVVLGFLDQVLFGGSLTVYGVLFLPVCVLTAFWVRRGDLLIAPVVVPISFAAGLSTVADRGDGGVGGRLMGLVTALATEAGWLYGGTLVAGSIVLARRIRLVRRRAAAARNRSTAS